MVPSKLTVDCPELMSSTKTFNILTKAVEVRRHSKRIWTFSKVTIELRNLMKDYLSQLNNILSQELKMQLLLLQIGPTKSKSLIAKCRKMDKLKSSLRLIPSMKVSHRLL
jgi:hypothetical protein